MGHDAIRYPVRPSKRLPSLYNYALFNLHDGVNVGTATEAGVDANPANTWELAAANFNAAVWTTRNGWWTGALASQRAMQLDTSAHAVEAAAFLDSERLDGQVYLVACQVNLPAYATAVQRVFSAGVNNNAELFQLRYLSGDLLQFLAGDNDVVAGSMDITAAVDTDLVVIGVIDDREGFKTISSRVYAAGTKNLIAAQSASLASVEWLVSASTRYLNIGSMPNTPTGNPLTGSVRRLLLVPMAQNPPANWTAVYEELAAFSISRFETL